MADLQVVRKIQENLTHHCPVSHLYEVDGGESYLLVTVKDPHVLRELFAQFQGTTQLSHIENNVDVFLTDEFGSTIFDADGNPENGLNPIASTDPQSIALQLLPSSVQTHEDALAALGYTLADPAPERMTP